MTIHAVTTRRASIPGDTSKRWPLNCTCKWEEFAYNKTECEKLTIKHLDDETQ